MTQQPQTKQKLLNAGESVKEPRKKEMTSVSDVIVTDGPA